MPKKRINVAVLVGGPSSEHEVSLHTGAMVMSGLDPKKYRVRKVLITRKGEWKIPPAELKKRFDVAFIAMHGEYGEDGVAQKLLAAHGIPYTGSDARASALGMDKAKSSRLFQRKGLAVPEFVLAPKTLPPPVVIKPADRGSSVGISIASKPSQYAPAILKASKHSPNIMVQRYIQGREMTCGVLEIDGAPVPLVPTEIIPRKRKFFDYEAKYIKGASWEITPPKVSDVIIQQLQKAAVKAHTALGARGVSRTDFIMAEPKGKKPVLYVLEINTIPGMTRTSLLPQGARAAGISFSKMLDYIIGAALTRG